MKLLISGDVHGKVSNIQTFHNYLNAMINLQVETQPDLVVILGDLFDSHAIIRSEILNLWTEYLNKVVVKHILMVGNHDQVSPGSSVHALVSLSNSQRVTVVGGTPFTIENLKFVGFIKDQTEFSKTINSVNGLKPKILFCHQTFEGAQFENGFYAPGGVPISSVADFELVVAGDIHKGQQFANIWCVGTPYQMNFNDAGDEKFVWLFDTDTLERKPISLGLPQYVVYKFNDAGLVLDPKLFENSKNRYKVILEDSRPAIQSLLDSTELKEIRKSRHVVVSPKYVETVNNSIKIEDSLSPVKMLERYIMDIMNTELDRKIVLDEAAKTLEEAK